MSPSRTLGLVRPMLGRDPAEQHRAATPLELLFDLSFVVAIAAAAAELHHEVAAGHVADGVVSYAAVFFGIWWAWMNFTWFASSFDTDDVPYRLLTFLQIVGVLVLTVGVPDAFEGDFALATVGYVIMRVALVTQWTRAARGSAERGAVARRYAIGICILQVLWLLRLALPEGVGLVAFFMLAAAELAVPAIAEPDASSSQWHPEHIAERYGLFTIIVIGESILSATGAIRVALDDGLSVELLTIAGGGLTMVLGLWWLYFERQADEALRDVGRGAFAWGYGHYVLFAALAALGAGLAVAAEQPGHGLAISPVGQALAVGIPAAIALGAIAVLQAYLHREPRGRTARLLVAAVGLVVLGMAAPIPLGLDVALMGLVVALVVVADVFTQAAAATEASQQGAAAD